MTLTTERLKELLNYDPETGIFVWKVRTSNRTDAGHQAGGRNTHHGYVIIGIDGHRLRAHRLAWLYMTGSWPAQQVDHINGERADNRFSNLRELSSRENTRNQRKAKGKTASGMLGVYLDQDRNKKWRATIKTDDGQKHLGRFYTKEEAHAAYVEAKRKYHASCTI